MFPAVVRGNTFVTDFVNHPDDSCSNKSWMNLLQDENSAYNRRQLRLDVWELRTLFETKPRTYPKRVSLCAVGHSLIARRVIRIQ